MLPEATARSPFLSGNRTKRSAVRLPLEPELSQRTFFVLSPPSAYGKEDALLLVRRHSDPERLQQQHFAHQRSRL